jgi:hypothetical protein
MNIKILFSICFVSFINSVAFSQKDKLWYLNLRSSLDVKIGNVNSKLKLTIHNTKLHRITYDGKVYACKIKIQNDSTSIKDVYIYDGFGYYFDPLQLENRMRTKIVSFNILYPLIKGIKLRSGDKGEIEFIFPFFTGMKSAQKKSIINSSLYVGAHQVFFNGNFVVDGSIVKLTGVNLPGVPRKK